jgi:predicted nucleotidyltransferase
MNNKKMAYTLDEIKTKIKPIAEKYDIPAVYLFGSYARGEANDGSDVDLAFDYTGSKITSFLREGGLHNDLESAFPAPKNKKWGFDIFNLGDIEYEQFVMRNEDIVDSVLSERVKIYGE